MKLLYLGSNFTNLNSSTILADASDFESQVKTEVKFENCNFSNNTVTSKAFIEANNAIKMTIENSLFEKTVSLFERSSLFHTQQNSELIIKN